MVANFDSAPTADSEFFGKLDSSIRDEHESRVSLCCGWSSYHFPSLHSNMFNEINAKMISLSFPA